jgi:hypothetical protein
MDTLVLDGDVEESMGGAASGTSFSPVITLAFCLIRSFLKTLKGPGVWLYGMHDDLYEPPTSLAIIVLLRSMILNPYLPIPIKRGSENKVICNDSD